MKKSIRVSMTAAVCLLLASIDVLARERTIRGIVIGSDTDEPLAGVAVHLKENPKLFTTTNARGEYALKIPSDGTVVFDLLGYDSKEIKTDHEFLFSLVTLVVQPNALDEVVVVGFGTQNKQDIIGAIQSVSPDNLTITTSSLTSSFAGNVPGLISMRSTGEPGVDNATFYIRGIGTFGHNAAPLVIIDGVETESQTMLNMIPPESIESFSVLKDATATALYGTKGANGVIVINTKEGRNSEKMDIDIAFDSAVSMPTRIQDVADGVTYMENYNEAVYNMTRAAGEDYVPFYSQEKIEGTRQHLNPYVFPDNDWYKLLFKGYAINEHLNITARGGGKKVAYFLNAGIHNEGSIFRQPSETPLKTGLYSRRIMFQSNVSAYFTRTTKVTMKLNYQIRFRMEPQDDPETYFNWTMLANPVWCPPVLPAEEGDTFVRYGNNSPWAQNTGTIDRNPYARLSCGYKHINHMFGTAILGIDQDLGVFAKGLSANATVTFYNYSYAYVRRNLTPFYFKVGDYVKNPDGTYSFTTEPIGPAGSTFLSSSVGDTGHHRWTFQAQLAYKQKFGRHSVGADVVYLMKEKQFNASSPAEDKILPFREQGLAARVTYNFDKRYRVEADFGYNGSENFIAGKRFGFFPSVALGWTVSNEKFFKPLKKVISNLKMRASYGLVGNDALAVRFPYFSSVDMGARSYPFGNNFSFVGAGYVKTYGNENASWELAHKTNVGIDIGLFKELSLSADYFTENRSDIFYRRRTIPSGAGLGAISPYANIGKVKNRGFDMEGEYKRMPGKECSLVLRGTFTYAHNEVVNMDEPEYTPENQHLYHRGHPINSMHLLCSDGIFTSQAEIDESPRQTYGSYNVGDIKYKDINGDGKIDANDRVWTKLPTVPEIQYGFGGTLCYKKYDFTFMLQGTGRVVLRMSGHHPFASGASLGYGIMQYIADDHWSWDDNDAHASYPRLTTVVNENNTVASDFWLRKAHFLRLKNIEFGCTFRKKYRVFLNGSDLFFLSPFTQWDPEMGSGNGLDAYPLQRSVKLGIQAKF